MDKQTEQLLHTILKNISSEIKVARDMKDGMTEDIDKAIYNGLIQGLLTSKILIRNAMIKDAKSY